MILMPAKREIVQRESSCIIIEHVPSAFKAEELINHFVANTSMDEDNVKAIVKFMNTAKQYAPEHMFTFITYYDNPIPPVMFAGFQVLMTANISSREELLSYDEDTMSSMKLSVLSPDLTMEAAMFINSQSEKVRNSIVNQLNFKYSY